MSFEEYSDVILMHAYRTQLEEVNSCAARTSKRLKEVKTSCFWCVPAKTSKNMQEVEI